MYSQTELVDLISTAPHKHLLVLDTNIAIHQIDVLEYKCPSTSFVVVLQTVLQEIQHLDVSIYRRICALLQDETKSYIFFPNEQVSRPLVFRHPILHKHNNLVVYLIGVAIVLYCIVLHGIYRYAACITPSPTTPLC